jgi:predicted transcriptional regulator
LLNERPDDWTASARTPWRKWFRTFPGGVLPWYHATTMPKNMTLRLTDEQAAELDAIAQVENVPVAEEVRRALAEHIAARRKDREFQARLKASIERNQEILRRLASD